MSSKTMQLKIVSLPSPEAGFTDCAYVCSRVLEALAGAAGVDPEAAKKRGMLVAVGEAVLYAKCVRAGWWRAQ